MESEGPVKRTVKELAGLLGCSFSGDGSSVVSGVAPLEEAGPGDVTFVSDRRNLKLLGKTNATAVIMKDSDFFRKAGAGFTLILAGNPQLAFGEAVKIFRPAPCPAPGIDARAAVHPGARLGEGVSVQAFAVVEDGAQVSDGVVLYPGVYVGRDARIGEDTVVYSGAAVREGCVIGKRVIIHCNAVIGSDGFGYAREGGTYFKIPQAGIVRVSDDVEIGACSTIDRATLGETVIGRGVKIDNLVQVAHNVSIGEDTVIAAQTGIAGSTTIGRGVQFGGQAGVAGHIKIGDEVLVGAKAGVTGDLPGGAAFSGFPAIEQRQWLRAQNLYAKLPEIKKRIVELEKVLKALEEKGS
ncbi:MAG: UDP-3-O-(3-hydroxymyristoyl)glucosamine N-acyltransferase [Thermodesulfobacteriota bacterium]|nr:MAG: UDP-3-O-(3-hydroxymyristoyl)glucosamine N-acyltransferase [Thermodesulfobacteriota bacterium]